MHWHHYIKSLNLLCPNLSVKIGWGNLFRKTHHLMKYFLKCIHISTPLFRSDSAVMANLTVNEPPSVFWLMDKWSLEWKCKFQTLRGQWILTWESLFLFLVLVIPEPLLSPPPVLTCGWAGPPTTAKTVAPMIGDCLFLADLFKRQWTTKSPACYPGAETICRRKMGIMLLF